MRRRFSRISLSFPVDGCSQTHFGTYKSINQPASHLYWQLMLYYIKPNRTFTNIFHSCFMYVMYYVERLILERVKAFTVVCFQRISWYFFCLFSKGKTEATHHSTLLMPFSLSLHIIYSFTLKIWMTTMTKDFFFHFRLRYCRLETTHLCFLWPSIW